MGTFFDVYRSNLTFNPLSGTPKTRSRPYEVYNGVRVYKQAPVGHHYLFPAQFNLDHNQVSISDPHKHGRVERLRFCMVPAEDDYLVHVYENPSDPVVSESLVNWRIVSPQLYYGMSSSRD